MTPEAIKSDVVRKEWRFARQEGVGVLPVLGSEKVNFSTMPRWMQEQHIVDFNNSEQWTRLIRTLESPYQGARVPFMVDDLPDGFVPRPDEFRQLKERAVGSIAGGTCGHYGGIARGRRLWQDDSGKSSVS